MKQTFTCFSPSFSRKFSLKILATLAILLTIGVGNVWADKDFSHTYIYSEKGTGSGKTWDVTNAENATTYWKVPSTTSNPSVATVAGIFTGKNITSNVVITLDIATFGDGDNPTSSKFEIYNSSACTSQVTASQGGTLPNNSTYRNTTYTITKANAIAGFSSDLAIKIASGTKQIRLRSFTVAFTYTDKVVEPYTVKFYKTDGTSEDIDEDSAGAGVTPPDMAETCGDWEFQGWSKTESDDEESTAELTLVTLDEGVYYPTANTTLYPVYTMDGTVENEVEDVITQSTTGLCTGGKGCSSGYTAWSNKQETSDAVYAGHSNAGVAYIQLNSTNPSGIITTTSGGVLKSVEVEWNSSTTNARTITVYGKKSAYSEQADVYDASKRGTSFGTIVKGTSTLLDDLNEDDSYTYVGIKANGALYIDQITITWIVEEDVTYYYSYPDCSSPAQVKTPTFSVSEGSYIENQSVTISCATDGATIYYTTDGNDPTTSSSTYSSAISISSTTTVKAMAVKSGLTDSEIASATYTIRPSKVYNLVTDASALGIGDKIVILETGGTYALDTTQNSNNRGACTDFVLSGSTVRVPDNGKVQPITLEAYAEGYWYFKVGDDKYLSAPGSSSNNYLRSQTKTTVTSDSRGKWSIALDGSGVFTVKTNDGPPNNIMRYNSSSSVFACYSTATQTAVKVYAYQNTSPTIETNTASLSGFSATYGGSASDAQNVYVSGRNLNGNITVTPPTGYEIKKSGDASYSSSAITLTPSSKKVSVTLNVRLAAGNNAGDYEGNLTLVGYNSEASTNVAMTGTVAKMTPVITFTLDETAALANTAVGYTLSSTSDATALTFSYKRGDATVSAMITNDTENKTISISQAGTYKIRVNQAADDNHNAAAQVEQELTITVRDVFKDMVNGYSDINGDDTGSGITTPTFAEMESGAQNTCNSTTRYLIGWIKAADLTTIYSGETGYLEDAAKYEANKAKLVAPGAETTASGVTWYAVWAEEEE